MPQENKTPFRQFVERNAGGPAFREPAAPTSWSPEVRVFGETKFVGNALRFATETEAKQQVHNLMMRWTLVEETRVVATADPVTARWVHAESRLETLPVAKQMTV